MFIPKYDTNNNYINIDIIIRYEVFKKSLKKIKIIIIL